MDNPRPLKMPTPNGVILHASVWPSTRRSTCILPHGFGHDSRAWDPLARALKESCRVVALDFRGHGDSAWDASRSYCHNALLQDLDTVVATLKLQRFHLVGHSMGARVGMLYAARNPGAISSLTIIDTGPEVGAKGVRRIREDAENQPRLFDSRESYFLWLRTRHPLACRERLLHMAMHSLRPVGTQWQPKTDPEFARILWHQDNPGGADEPHVAPLTKELWDALDHISCRTLVMRGQLSSILKQETARTMVEDRLIAGELATVAMAGHAVMLDNPGECSAIITRFINRACAAERGVNRRAQARWSLRALRH